MDTKKKYAIAGSILAAVALVAVLSVPLFAPAYADNQDEDGPPPVSGDEAPDQEESPEEAEPVEEVQSAPLIVPEALSHGVTLNTAGHVAYMFGDNDRFDPNGYLTRAQTAIVLQRLMSQPVTPTASFSDVPADAWYADAANTLGTLGIVTTDTFQPDQLMSRGEFIRYLGSFFPPRTDGSQFPDVADSDPNAPYILSARAWGWVNGSSDGSFHPEDLLTRADATVILNRVLARSADREYLDSNVRPVFYWDVDPSDWYYYDIMEASAAHEYTGDVSLEQWTSCAAAAPAGLVDGFQHIDGWLYYFDGAKNDLVRSASVGNFDFDAEGHFTSGNEELDGLLHDIYQTQTEGYTTQEERLKALYRYTRDSFTYLRRPPYEFGVLDYMETDALRILTTGYGNCYCYASLFWYLSRWEGYDSRIVNGTVGQRRSPHSWVEITFDGRSYIFDTELEMSYRKKGQNINMYKWLGEGWSYIK